MLWTKKTYVLHFIAPQGPCWQKKCMCQSPLSAKSTHWFMADSWYQQLGIGVWCVYVKLLNSFFFLEKKTKSGCKKNLVKLFLIIDTELITTLLQCTSVLETNNVERWQDFFKCLTFKKCKNYIFFLENIFLFNVNLHPEREQSPLANL